MSVKTSNSSKDVEAIEYNKPNTTEFVSLTKSIAENIASIRSNGQHLEKTFKIIGTAKDNQSIREEVHQIQLTTNGKIETTRKVLQRLAVVLKHGDKIQRLQVEKLTSTFQDIVESYSLSQKKIAKQLKTNRLRNSLRQSFCSSMRMSFRSSTNGNDIINQQQSLELKILSANLDFERMLMVEREQRVRQIETDVIDIHKIMDDLAEMINEQGPRIDAIIMQPAIDEIEIGSNELKQAEESHTKHSSCKLLVLLIVSVIIVSILIVVAIVFV